MLFASTTAIQSTPSRKRLIEASGGVARKIIPAAPSFTLQGSTASPPVTVSKRELLSILHDMHNVGYCKV